jgi:adenylate cyclase
MPATGSTREPQTSERLWHKNIHSTREPQQHWSYSSTVVDAALQMEILRSEQRRVALMIAVLTLLLLFIVSIFVAPQIYSPEARARLQLSARLSSVLVAGYLVYELTIRFWLARLLSEKRTPPVAFRYINTLVEISLPTAALLVFAFASEPLSALAGSIPFIYFPLILLTALNLDSRLCVFAGVTASVQFLAVALSVVNNSVIRNPAIPVLSMLLSPHQYVFKAALLLAGGLIAAFAATQIRKQMARVMETLDQRDRAISIFGQHVSPQVAELLLKQPVDYTGQERNVCVMFLDIRDFSKLSSERSAPEVVGFLNKLFGPMIPIINRYSGVVNKFLGDGFMAVFGAPIEDGQQCRHAIQAALEILREVERLNQDGSIPATRVGIGLHFGQAVTGNVGTSDRKEYTIIGDVVNLASRIEQANKPLASQLLISEAVANAIRAGGDLTATDMGLVELKGQPHPIRLFRLA